MKIYTKGGDKGYTSLVSGNRVPKNDARIEAYGTVDELNAHCGLLLASSAFSDINKELIFVQNCLFNVGSILAKDGVSRPNFPTLTLAEVEKLEKAIDIHTNKLTPLKQFILPSGSNLIALSHICRTITRRAERRVISLQSDLNEIELVVVFLNRLSDYFFTLARSFAHLEGLEEVPWNARLD